MCARESQIRIFALLFDVHVLKFAGLEDFATFLAFNELRILVAAHDLHTRMLTGLLHIYVLRGGGRL